MRYIAIPLWIVLTYISLKEIKSDKDKGFFPFDTFKNICAYSWIGINLSIVLIIFGFLCLNHW